MQRLARAVPIRAGAAATRWGILRPATAGGAHGGVAAPTVLAAVQGRGMASLAATLDAITLEIPQKEAVRYHKGNVKWTRADVKKHSDALASGLLDLGCKPGDTMAVWLPECSEKHVAQLAAAKAGMILAEVDPALTSAAAFEKVLEESRARVVLVGEDGLAGLKEAVPELRHYSSAKGLPFRSRRFPDLHLCLHTGLDADRALSNFKSVLLYHPMPSPLPKVQALVQDDTPLTTPFAVGAGGAPVKGPTLSQAEVLEKGAWATVAAILSKKYVEV